MVRRWLARLTLKATAQLALAAIVAIVLVIGLLMVHQQQLVLEKQREALVELQQAAVVREQLDEERQEYTERRLGELQGQMEVVQCMLADVEVPGCGP